MYVLGVKSDKQMLLRSSLKLMLRLPIILQRHPLRHSWRYYKTLLSRNNKQYVAFKNTHIHTQTHKDKRKTSARQYKQLCIYAPVQKHFIELRVTTTTDLLAPQPLQGIAISDCIVEDTITYVCVSMYIVSFDV